NMAGRFAFLPKRLAGATEVPGLSVRDRSAKGFLIHVRNHQHVAGFGIGDNSRDQTVGVEFGCERQACFDIVHGLGQHQTPFAVIMNRVRETRASDGGEIQQTRSTTYRCPPRTMVMKRTCSLLSSRNAPVKCVVTVRAPGFSTPRSDMHMCSASIMTATPR